MAVLPSFTSGLPMVFNVFSEVYEDSPFRNRPECQEDGILSRETVKRRGFIWEVVFSRF